MREYKKQNRKSTCHPDAPHYARGLCLSCWQEDRKDRSRRLERARYHANIEAGRQKNRNKYAKNKPRHLERLKKYKAIHPERVKASRRATMLRTLYGLTPQEYEAILARQNGCCAICKEPPAITARVKRLHVDHCHSTGRVRGLLCNLCNRGIGALKDNPLVLFAAIVYLGIEFHPGLKLKKRLETA